MLNLPVTENMFYVSVTLLCVYPSLVSDILITLLVSRSIEFCQCYTTVVVTVPRSWRSGVISLSVSDGLVTLTA